MALTFGGTGLGTGEGSIEAIIRGGHYVCPEAAIAEKITARLTVVTAAHNVKAAIYRFSDGAKIGETEILSIPISGVTWRNFVFSAPKPELVSGVEYELLVWGQPTAGDVTLRFGPPDSPYTYSYKGLTYGAWPDTLAISHGNFQACIYCTYSLPSNPYPTAWLKKGLVSGFHVFLNQYIKSKVLGYDPLKLPDGTIF